MHNRRDFLKGMLGGGLIAKEPQSVWQAEAPLLLPGPRGAFDHTAVKDPSPVFFNNRWHVFYTARGNNEYTTGYVSAAKLNGLRYAKRYQLKNVKSRRSSYACAPQVFYFRPHKLWYLIFQTNDANYQPAFSTTQTINDPASWSDPVLLLRKDVLSKWIDFWIICDDARAYLFYTQDHRDVFVRTTSLEDFPHNWGEGSNVFTGVHEAVHVFKAQGRNEYHMIYELNTGERSFGLARAEELSGPWMKVTDQYASGAQLSWRGRSRWTEMISHGELIRTGCDELLEYDAKRPTLLIQGVRKSDYREPYTEIPWVLGSIRRK